MIKVNLLPPELQSKKAAPARKGQKSPGSPKTVQLLILALFLLFALVWYVVGYLYAWSNYAAARDEAEATRAKAAKLEKEVKKGMEQYKDMFSSWTLWREQLEIVDELMPENRLLWSEKINMLSNLVPEGVYITDLRLDELVELVETSQSASDRVAYEKEKKRIDGMEEGTQKAREQRELGAAPAVRKKPVITQLLKIKAVTQLENLGPDRLKKVIEFRQNMQTHEATNARGETRRFRDFFTQTGEDDASLRIEDGVMQADTLDGVPVWSFELILTTETRK
jgi:Tfp pilus assembly protein PilN